MDAVLQQILSKFNQGPVQVVIDPSGDNVELAVEDGVDLSFLRGQETQEADVVGTYDLISSGDAATFELRVPEDSINAVRVLFPEGMDATDGAGDTYMGWGRAAGYSYRTIAKEIRIRPWQTRTSGDNQITFWKCVPEGDAARSMKKSEKYQYNQTFRALPDVTKDDTELICRIKTTARS